LSVSFFVPETTLSIYDGLSDGVGHRRSPDQLREKAVPEGASALSSFSTFNLPPTAGMGTIPYSDIFKLSATGKCSFDTPLKSTTD
jgi:hypothetical protein